MIRRSPIGVYRLEGRTPVPCFSHTERFWQPMSEKQVAYTQVRDGVSVSTVFLHMDHGYGGGPPVLFETMVFWEASPEWDNRCERYTTWEDAEIGHTRIVAEVDQAVAEVAPHA